MSEKTKVNLPLAEQDKIRILTPLVKALAIGGARADHAKEMASKKFD